VADTVLSASGRIPSRRLTSAAVATVREDEGARRTLIPFRWRMAGGEGAGVYDLAEPPANASRV